MISRNLTENIRKRFFKGKAIILIGPRQVGKTTLIYELLKGKDFLFIDGDDAAQGEMIATANTEELRSLIGRNKFVFIDEVQRIADIGLKLKIITDQFKDVQLIASGSSALDINNILQEPLTGRKFEYHLYPIAWNELEKSIGLLKSSQQFDLRLVYGMYPDAINNPGDEYTILKNLTSSYLYKDILSLANIRKPEVLNKILQALAYQVGSEVSYNEIAQLVGVDKNTVSNYIDLLEKAYIVFRLRSFSRNHRNEIKFNQKIYFYDNGIRNMIIGDLNPLPLRQDKGPLFENFLISERKKVLELYKKPVQPYFWRTTRQQEIDYIEVEAQEIRAYEFKWNETKKARIPKPFRETYDPEFTVVNRKNYREFLK